MSVDINLLDDHCCDAHNHQFTYNYTPMLREVGFPAWKYFDGHKSRVLKTFLEMAILEIETRREQVGTLIKGGGQWGTVSTFLSSARSLLDDCLTHPDATVRVS